VAPQATDGMMNVSMHLWFYRYLQTSISLPPCRLPTSPPFKGGFSHLAASPPFSFACPLSRAGVPEGEHLLDDRVIWHENVS